MKHVSLSDADSDSANKGRPQPLPVNGYLIAGSGECRGCWGCVRICPARAIRVSDMRAEVIQEKCVQCGACVSDCSTGGFVVRDDTAKVRELLRGDRPVVAVLATEFVAAMYPLSPLDVERRLEAIGFFAVESTLLGEEMVAAAYEQLHARRDMLFVLRSTCPVVVDWVLKYRPALAGALAPVVPPYVAQARLVKGLYPEGTAVVYASPCYARKDEAEDPQFEGAVDAVVDFIELKRMLEEVSPVASRAVSMTPGSRRPHLVKEISLTDGFPRRTIAGLNLTDPHVSIVRGLRQVDRLLGALERGEAAPSVVDMLNCEGCIDGPAVSPGSSVFAKRGVVAAHRLAHPVSSVSTRALLNYVPSVDVKRSFTATPVVESIPTDAEIDTCLAEGEFLSREEVLDCGACGYATCVEHAVAVTRGNSTWDMCFPLQKARLTRNIEKLQETALLDPLTNLWNRRAFSERLAAEFERYERYATPLALLMLDLDDFKMINDVHGHLGGDQVLKATADLMRQALRATDAPVRYGGDEFAIVLPGITKTDAYAVAEKLRQGIRALAFDLGTSSNGGLRVTASIGVASAGPGTGEAADLLEAADRALYQAKQGGRDQVRLAAG